MRGAPAAISTLLFLVACGVAPGLRATPAWTIVGLAAAGIGLGGRPGMAVLAISAGLWLGEGRRTEAPSDASGLVAEVEGRVCGPWRARSDLPGRSAKLCTRWMRVRGGILVRPPSLFVDLPAGDGEPPAFGALLAARGPLSRFPGLANLPGVEPGPWRLRVKSHVFLRLRERAGRFARISTRLRRRLERAVTATKEGARPGVALARALVIGDDDGFGLERRRALRRLGLSHLFVVSGFNLTVVVAFAAWISGVGPRASRLVLPSAAVLLYLAAVGPEPSMLRASIVAGVGFAIVSLRRNGAPLRALSLAALCLVGARPDLVDDVGFRLSFGATAGLIVGARWFDPTPVLPRAASVVWLASLAAQLGALPFAIAAFGQLSPLTPIANLVAVPWAAAWLLVGMAWYGLAVVEPNLASQAAPLLDVGAAPFEWLDRLPPSLWLSVVLNGGLAGGVLLTASVAWVAARRHRRRAAPLLVLAVVLSHGRPAAEERLEVAFLDVGQGDAAIVYANRFVVAIDGGGASGRDLAATALRPSLFAHGIAEVDLAILSHSDRDHCQGLLDLAALVPIRELWSSPAQLRRGCGARLRSRIAGPVRGLTAGERLVRGGMRFSVLHPGASDPPGGANAESLAFIVEVGGRRFLFTGDLGAGEERTILARQPSEVSVDVLKVAHHGSAASTSRAWLRRVRTHWAVVSAGARNAYGHPSPATLARLNGAALRVLRTDRDGQVVFRRCGNGPWRLLLPASPRERPRDR